MATLIHRTALLNIPNIKLKGFRKAIRGLLDADSGPNCADPDCCDCSDDPASLSTDFQPLLAQLLPDGYTIVTENGGFEVVCYEAEVSHPLTDEKLMVYGKLWFDLDSISDRWCLRLVCVDRYFGHHEIDLRHWYFVGVLDDIGQPAERVAELYQQPPDNDRTPDRVAALLAGEATGPVHLAALARDLGLPAKP